MSVHVKNAAAKEQSDSGERSVTPLKPGGYLIHSKQLALKSV